MRAVAVSEFGATPEIMELPVPEPGPGQVQVRMRAAGLNPFDWKVADGVLGGKVRHRFPLVLGGDGAGEVAALGGGVTGFAVGDLVFGLFMRLRDGGGSYGEYAVADAVGLARIPDGVAVTDAAALPMAGTTALNLVAEAGVARGQTVLVVGATGGVGTFVVQLAAARGAHVIATAPAGRRRRGDGPRGGGDRGPLGGAGGGPGAGPVPAWCRCSDRRRQ